MGFNEEELLKIEGATTGFTKRAARKMISGTLRSMRAVISEVKLLNPDEREAKYKEYLEVATAQRQKALMAGARSHGDKNWATAAVCESWLQSLLLDSPDEIERVEEIIDRLITRG